MMPPLRKSHFFTLFLFLIPILALAAPALSEGGSVIDGVMIFPPDHIWNVPAVFLDVESRSAGYVENIGETAYLHADFGSGLWEGHPIGIPYNIVSGSQQKRTVSFQYAGESDPGPYPIPDDPLIEGGSDHHLLIVDRDAGMLYELYAAGRQANGSWSAGSGAVFNLSGYDLRPDGWTSADAAGLAMLPGLVRYDEVAAGEITHAIRFTAPSTQKAYVWPARHFASQITDESYPPMGQRFRLKASFNTTGYPYQARVVLEALKKYGMILSDNGAPWFIGGVPDERWDNDALHTLHQVKGSDFEAVDGASLMITPDSGKARTASPDSVSMIGVYRNGTWYLDRNGDRTLGPGDLASVFGAPGWGPVIGDWNADGSTEIGVYRNGSWYLDVNGDGAWGSGDAAGGFGAPGWIPVIGDWDGTGSDRIGVYRDGTWYLDVNGDRAWGAGDAAGGFGAPGWIPVIGDWDGTGSDRIGVYRDGTWYLDVNGDRAWGAGDAAGGFGAPGWIPVIGDWDGTGSDRIGVYRDGTWYLDVNGDRAWGSGDAAGGFGAPGWIPVIGDWDGTGQDRIGVYRDGTWYLDVNGDRAWGAGDAAGGFGAPGWIPVISEMAA